MDRVQALARSLTGRVDALLVSGLTNVRYLTGFTGSSAALVVTAAGDAILATDGRYATQAAAEAPDVELVVGRRVAAEVLTHAAGRGQRRIGIERHLLTLSAYDDLVAAAPHLELVDGGRAVEQLRVVKDDAELAALATACRITDEVFAATLSHLRAMVTESDIAWLMATELHSRGATPAFDTIVAFGPNSARPHHQPTTRPLAAGDLVKLDFGALVDGYHADMTRTVVLGPAADWQRDLHALVADIQAGARAATAVDAVPVDLDADVRRHIESAGYEPAHGLGHGVGLEIHEAPFLVPASDAARLVDRVPVTVEPGIYLPGQGGVRIEDTVVVRTDGTVSLTNSPRELIEI